MCHEENENKHEARRNFSFFLLLYKNKKSPQRRILDGGRREKQYYAVGAHLVFAQ